MTQWCTSHQAALNGSSRYRQRHLSPGLGSSPDSGSLWRPFFNMCCKFFFPRASERRVLLIVEVCHHILSSHLLIFTSSHTLSSYICSHLLIFSHLLASSHIFSHFLASTQLHIFSSSHLLTPSHLTTAHIFSSSHIFSHLLTSSHIFSHLHIFYLLTSSHLLTSSLSCPLALFPSCPLLFPSFLFFS